MVLSDLQILDLGRLIGSGSFGHVYEAVALTKKKPIALKQMQTDEEFNWKEVKRAAALSKKMKIEKIPGVARMYGLIEFDNELYIGMQFCNRGNLLDFVLNNALSPGKKIQIGIQIGNAIVKLHEAGFIHHDLKLDNILIHNSNYLIGDMGLADKKTSSKLIPINFNWRFSPLCALTAVKSKDPKLQAGIWNDFKYDDSMFGLLLWQLFTNNYNSLPWLIPGENKKSFQNRFKMGEECLFRENAAWDLPEKIQGQAKAIIRGLRSWEKDHISTEKAVQKLSELQQQTTMYL